MANRNYHNKNKILTLLLGETTPAKASGLTYTLAALFSVVLAFIFLFVIGVIGVDEGYETRDWYLYCSFLLTPVCFALVAWWVLRWSKASLRAELSSQICPVKYFIVAIVLQIGLFCLSQLNSIFLEWLGNFGYQDTPIHLPSMDGWGFVGTLITVALLPAVFEEIIFRGLLLKGMRSFGTLGAVLVNGALFALYHQNPAQTMYQFCCGAAFALMAIRAGSILPTVLSHFINNALIVTLTKFGIDTFSPAVGITVFAVSVLCLAISLYWLVFVDRENAYTQQKNKDAATARKQFFVCASVGIAFCALTWIMTLMMGM